VICSGDILMAVSMCVIQDRNGTWIVRKKVPKHLREPVARLLDNDKEQRTWLQRSTGTKNKAEAKRLAPAIMAEFAKVLQDAEELLAERPRRTTLTQAEIGRIAEFYYAEVLAADEAFTTEGAAEDEAVVRSIADKFDQFNAAAAQLNEPGIKYDMPIPLDAQRPAYGLTNRQVAKREAELAWYLPIMRAALSRGDIGKINEIMTELLDRFHIKLDPNSLAYRQLGMAVLRASVRANEALERRYRGEPIETPAMANLEPSLAAVTTLATQGTPGVRGAPTLRTAFEGWKKEGTRTSKTTVGYEHAVCRWEQLHGDIPVAEIRKQHALQFRQALQEVPKWRTKALAKLTLPQLVEWHREHPSAPCLTTGAVNKLMAGVQALAKWAEHNGLVPDDIRWSDPFTGMKLAPSDEQGGGPFEPEELQRLFRCPIFTKGERPEGGQGETSFWLPLLALFTGCRRSELTKRKARDVSEIEGQWCLSIVSAKDQPLKTLGSARTLPIHPELVRLGFLEFVKVAKAQGEDGWLFPAVATDKIANNFSQWFGRYLGRLGLRGNGRGLHSFRHNFIDALRAAGVPENLQDALTGHSNRTVGRTYGARPGHSSQRHKVIVKRYGMPRLIQTIGRVQYPGIDLEAVRWRPKADPSRQRTTQA
jgi:integrase